MSLLQKGMVMGCKDKTGVRHFYIHSNPVFLNLLLAQNCNGALLYGPSIMCFLFCFDLIFEQFIFNITKTKVRFTVLVCILQKGLYNYYVLLIEQ